MGRDHPWVLLIALLFAATSAAAQSREFILQLDPFGDNKTELIELRAQERLRVSLEQTTGDIFVHAENKDLLDRDDPDKADTAYEFTAPRPGKYYVLVRNTGETRGIARVQVLPPSGAGRPALSQIAPKARVRLFYATDRMKVPAGGSPLFFGTEPSDGNQMTYGTVEISIPRFHDMGELEGPTIARLEFRQDPDKHIVLVKESLRTLDKRSFLGEVEQRVSATPNREALVFIHGFDNSFEDAARRTAQISYDLGFKGATVLYSWPSQGAIGVQEYLMDGENAQISVRSLETLLADLSTRAKTIHVIAHSMGNRLLTQALANMARCTTETSSIQQIALLAPDISVGMFRSLAAAFPSSAKRVTLYASSKDKALQSAKKLTGYPRVGQGGNEILILPQVDSIDVSDVDTSLLGFNHQYYGDSKSVIGDLMMLLAGKSPDERKGLRKDPQRRLWSMR